MTHELKSQRFLREQREQARVRAYHSSLRMTLAMLCLSLGMTLFLPWLGLGMIVFCLLAYPIIKRMCQPKD